MTMRRYVKGLAFRWPCLGSVAALVAACAKFEPALPPAKLIALTPTSDVYGVVGEQLVSAPEVQLVDGTGRPMAGVPVSFEVTSGGSVALTTTRTTSDGIATPETWVLGPKAGYQVLTASAEGQGVAATFSVYARAGKPAAMSCVEGCTQAGPSASTLLTPLQIKITDRFDNPIANTPVTFAIATGGGSIAPSSAMTDDSGVAEAWWSLGEVGANSGTASFAQFAVPVTAVARAAAPVIGTIYQLESVVGQISAVPGISPPPVSQIVLGNDGRFAEFLREDRGAILGNGKYMISDSTLILSYTDGFPGALITTTGYFSAYQYSVERATIQGDVLLLGRCWINDWDCHGALWTYRRVGQ